MSKKTSPSDRNALGIFQVRVHEGVYEDIEAIRAYIASCHPENAASYADKLIAAIDRLHTIPRAWPMVRTLRRSNVRQMSVSSHRLIFRVNDKAGVVDVYGIAHGKQQLSRNWLAQHISGEQDL